MGTPHDALHLGMRRIAIGAAPNRPARDGRAVAAAAVSRSGRGRRAIEPLQRRDGAGDGCRHLGRVGVLEARR